MKKLYVVLTKSSTTISKMINFLTKAEYTHSSISFTPKISPMYSFGRVLTFSNYPARLKKEPLEHGFYRIHNDVKVGVYEFAVTDEGYQKAYDHVMEMYHHRLEWRYSTLGLLFCKEGINVVRFHKRFCSEFVAECLQQTQEIDLGKPASLFQPIDFTRLKEGKCIFKGQIKDLVGIDFTKEDLNEKDVR